MKIKVKDISYEAFEKLEGYKYKKPKRRSFLLASIIRIAAFLELSRLGCKINKINMDKLGKKEPCLILMNHSSFIDLKIASKILYPRKYNIICTDDGFIGKELLMRYIGCVPTKKFLTDVTLVKDMMYVVKNLKSSILMYPEAGYSFDGTSIPLPNSIGKCLKLLKIPLVVITTHGAYHRDPLYNNLQVRKVNISADVKYVLSKEEIEAKSEKEIMEIIKQEFSFDNFKYQQDNQIQIKEPFRADYLNRLLYKCPHCLEERKMLGKGVKLICQNCNNEYELDEYGYLKNLTNETIFNHIPSWYKWEKECVKKEIEEDKYYVSVDVEIYALKDMKHVYRLGEGHLTHTKNGFDLIGCDNKLNYHQDTNASYTINSDFNWYERGDIISIGDHKARFYCLIKDKKDYATKVRFAAEILYLKNFEK